MVLASNIEAVMFTICSLLWSKRNMFFLQYICWYLFFFNKQHLSVQLCLSNLSMHLSFSYEERVVVVVGRKNNINGNKYLELFFRTKHNTTLRFWRWWCCIYARACGWNNEGWKNSEKKKKMNELNHHDLGFQLF